MENMRGNSHHGFHVLSAMYQVLELFHLHNKLVLTIHSLRAGALSVSLITVHFMSSTVPGMWQAFNMWINGAIISILHMRKTRLEKTTQLV